MVFDSWNVAASGGGAAPPALTQTRAAAAVEATSAAVMVRRSAMEERGMSISCSAPGHPGVRQYIDGQPTRNPRLAAATHG
jgi:hypothetical protein